MSMAVRQEREIRNTAVKGCGGAPIRGNFNALKKSRKSDSAKFVDKEPQS